MTATTKLGLELLQNGAANQTLANLTFVQLNQLVNAGVVDKDLSAPPGSPADEALYIVAGSATGLWAGKEGQLAYWLTAQNAWSFIPPLEGFRVRVLDEHVFYYYDGSAWAAEASGGGGGMTNPMTAVNDLIVGGTSGAPTRLAIAGTTGYVLTFNGTDVEWAAPTGGGMTNPMTTSGDIIYGGASGVPTRLAAGSDTQVLTLAGGVPTWAAPTSGGMTNPMTTANDLILGGVAGAPARLAAPGTTGFVLTWDGTEVVWAASSGGGMTNPMTTTGDLILGGASGAPGRLAIGTANFVLTSNGSTAVWAALPVMVPAPVVTEATTARTLALTDASNYIRCTAATVITVPPQSSVAWADDTEIHIEQSGAGAVTFAAGSGVTINKLSTNSLGIVGQYGVATLKRTGSDVWTLFGALAP